MTERRGAGADAEWGRGARGPLPRRGARDAGAPERTATHLRLEDGLELLQSRQQPDLHRGPFGLPAVREHIEEGVQGLSRHDEGRVSRGDLEQKAPNGLEWTKQSSAIVPRSVFKGPALNEAVIYA